MIDVIRGCFPYVLLFHVAVSIIAAMPWLATWLPSTMVKVGGWGYFTISLPSSPKPWCPVPRQ